MPKARTDRLARALATVRERTPWDDRAAVVDLRLEAADDGEVLKGGTTRPDIVEAVLAELGKVDEQVTRLPDERIGDQAFALVRSALAPVHAEPRVESPQLSQYVLGHRIDLLEQRKRWWRIRGEDGYIGWIHEGYLIRTGEDQALGWERGEEGEAVVSLGGALLDEAERPFALLPWGARVVREAGDRVRLPDGRSGTPAPGMEIVAADRLVDRFPARGESVLRTARRWLGAPYLWGGVVTSGVDCSGLVQSVFWMHGIALPRDSYMQALRGEAVEPGEDWQNLRIGDLLFFAEEGDRITHVAISSGGPGVIHSSISNGGVAENDLTDDGFVAQLLRRTYRSARRILPD